MGTFNKNYLLSTLLVLLGALSSFTTSADTAGIIGDVGQKPFLAITEREFNSLIDKVSQEKLQEALALIATEEKMDKFERARKAMLAKFTSHFSLKELKKMVAAQGIAVASITVAGEIVTSVILPTVFVALHVPFLAVISAAVPSPAYLLPTYFYFVNRKKNAQLAAHLGISVQQIKELNKLKSTILAYSVENKLFSLLSNSLEENSEIAVLKRSWRERTFQSANSNHGQLYLDEIEKLFTQHFPEQKDYLHILAATAEGDNSIYGMLLLSYLQTNPTAMADLDRLLATRAQEAVGDDSLIIIKKYLQIIEERQKSIEFRKKELMKAATSSAQAIPDLTALLDNIRQFEYRFLLFAQNQLQDPEQLAAQLDHFFRQWQPLDAQYQKVNAFIKSNQYSSHPSIRRSSHMGQINCANLLAGLRI